MSLTALDFAAASWWLRCDEPAIRAVARVEAGPQGAFLDSGEPTILFERHYFHRLTGGRYDRSHPHLSNRSPGGYGRYGEQHAKLAEAVELDRDAALKSASWGLMQIMGANHARAGHPTIQSFVNAMYMGGEAAHLHAFCAFVWSDSVLTLALRLHDWTTFAARYNGPAHARHDYSGRMAAAYRVEKAALA